MRQLVKAFFWSITSTQKQDTFDKILLQNITKSNERSEKHVARENLIVELDKAVNQLESVYTRLGDEAVRYPLNNYAINYLSKHSEWGNIKKEYPDNDNGAIIDGLFSCFRQPISHEIRMKYLKEKYDRLQANFVINPLLLDAEVSNPELKEPKAKLTSLVSVFADARLNELIELLNLFLSTRESYRVIQQLSLRYSIPSTKFMQAMIDINRLLDNEIPRIRGSIQRRIWILHKPWWVKWIYA